MCGILACVSPNISSLQSKLDHRLDELKARGPDMQKSIVVDRCYMGFTRLSINDLSENGMQPMVSEDGAITLICNGEIFNYKALVEKYQLHMKSNSDCEVILHMYQHSKNISEIVKELDGEFAFVLYDRDEMKMYATRDRFGVRPLFIGKPNRWDAFTVASEVKAILPEFSFVEQLLPGTITMFNCKSNEMTSFRYYDIFKIKSVQGMEKTILPKINTLLRKAVEKRLMSDRPVCCLLSGGLDSSLVAALVASHFPPRTIHTFSIGFEGSPDLHYANVVASHIQSVHHEIKVNEQVFLDNIPETIRIIESYDTTTVRASVGNMLVAKYISENTDNKVVFNGDYSDEVCGGYKYFVNAPSDEDFDYECKRLVNDICYFDSLRSDRSISSQGLEARVPFSDHAFVEYFFTIPESLRRIPDKYLLRKAFEGDRLLPPEVLWRPKEAFSDGVSKQTNSWHHIIKDHIDRIVSDDDFKKQRKQHLINPPEMKETFFYRYIFEKFYKAYANIIPYYWLPKWCKHPIVDPSAREWVTNA